MQMRLDIGVGSTVAIRPVNQQAEGGSIPTPTLHRFIKEVGHSTARGWVEQWHYSGRLPTGKNICYGLFMNNELYAVIVYGIGVNPYQAQSLGVNSVLEIKRMCRSEPPQDYPLSRFIAITAKMVKSQMQYDCLVAFADPAQGHEGTVYKAAGFVLHGVTGKEMHVVGADGVLRHRRYAYRYARRNNITIQQARDRLGLSRIATEPKYRWIRKAT